MIKGFDGVTVWGSDLNRLLPFYRDIIGFPVAMESPGFVILGEFDGPRICVGTHSEISGHASDRHRWLLRLECDDIHAEVARLKGHGVPIYEEPNHQGGGFWLATCEDPDGNLVQLNYWDKEFAQ